MTILAICLVTTATFAVGYGIAVAGYRHALGDVERDDPDVLAF